MASDLEKQYGILQNVMGDRIDANLLRAHWDDILRLMTSLRTRTVSASLMLKRLSATTRQSGLAQALRQMANGQHVPDYLLCSLSPLTWKHVNLTGDYVWEEKPALDEGGFRPLILENKNFEAAGER